MANLTQNVAATFDTGKRSLSSQNPLSKWIEISTDLPTSADVSWPPCWPLVPIAEGPAVEYLRWNMPTRQNFLSYLSKSNR
eukprot:1189284-Prorocentrum_minimum.AAC.4